MSTKNQLKMTPDFQEIVESLNDMIYELDNEGRFYYANSTLEKLSGYSKQELKKIHYWDLVKPGQIKKLRNFYKEQEQEKVRDTYFEFVMVNKAGKEIWVGQNVRMIFDSSGITLTRAVARDITHLRKLRLESEKRAKELEEKHSLTDLILNTMTDSVVVVNAEGDFLIHNEATKNIVGKDLSSMNPKEWSEHFGIFYPDKKTLIPSEELPMANALKGKEVYNFEVFMKNENNEGSFLKISSRPLRNPNGGVIGALVVTTNISEQRQAHDKLIESEERFRAMSDASPLGIFVTDQNGSCEYTNAEYQKLSGLTFEEALGEGWSNAIHEDDVERVFKQWNEAVSNNTIFDTEQRFRRKDGTVVWSKVKASAMKIQQDIIGYVGTVEDITEGKKYEKQLLEAKEDAEKASQAKEDFLSTMSHEIRTPLNAVIGMTHLLQGEEYLAHQEDNLSTLRFSADNLLVLINDILDYNKIESGKVVFEKVDVNLKHLVTRIRQTFALKAQEKSLRFNAIFDSDIPDIVLTDPVRLNQIITNLVANAIKFTKEGFVKIEVVLEEETAKNATISFSIKDSGIGISTNQIDRIFDRFTQAEKTTTRQFGGTGLGLAITKRLIELQKGSIRVDSEEGKGSDFYFTLLFEKGFSQPTMDASSENDVFPTNLNGTKVLIVEDNQINQVVVTKFLKKWNISTETANNGKEAIEKMKNNEYDLVLMDLQMPVMDGYEATEIIKQDPDLSSIPIIALTASALAEERDRVFKSGMEDFITKPLDPQELYLKIARTIDKEAIKVDTDRSAEPKQASNELINSKKIEMIADGDSDFLLKMYESYISELHKLKESYGVIVDKNDLDLYKATKHKMSASIDLFEAKLLGDELLKTEYLLENNESKKLMNNQKNISRLVETIIKILEKKIDDLK